MNDIITNPGLTVATSFDDNLVGTFDADDIDGLGGNDTLNGLSGNDTLDGYTGDDTLKGDIGNDLLRGYEGNDLLDGWIGDDELYGEAGNDTLLGFSGNDLLDGGTGDDILNGFGLEFTTGFGVSISQFDTLSGGAGADTFVLGDANGAFYLDGSKPGGDRYATITDFDRQEGDKIQVFGSASDYTLTPYNNGIGINYKGDLIGYVENTTDVIVSVSEKYEVTFSSTGQSTWGSGNSIQTGFNWEPFAPIQWDYTVDEKIGILEFGGGTKGDFHLRTGYEIDSGTIDSILPFEVLVDAPNRVAVGDTVTISTDYSLSDTSSFTTTTPYVNAYLDLGAKLYLGAYVGADLGILGKPRFDIADLLGTNIDYSIDFEFDTRDGEYSKTFDDFADFTLTSPDIAVSGAQTTDNKLSGSAEDVFLSTEISLDDLIVEKFLKKSTNPYLLGLGNAWQNSVDLLGVAGFSWDLLDLDIVGDISLKTSYDLTFDRVDGTLILEDGTTQAFTVGEDVSVDFLTGMDTNGNGQLDYDLKFDLKNPQLNTDVDLVFDLDFDVAALKANGWYDAWILGSDSKDFGPLFEESFDLAKGSIDIYEDTFALGGFNTESINDLAIAVV